MKRKAIAGLILVMLFLAILPASRNYAGTTDTIAIVRTNNTKSEVKQGRADVDTKEKIGVVFNDTIYFLRLVPAPDVNDPMGVPGPAINDPIEVEPDRIVPDTIPHGK
jgi:hypothetical protein